MKMKNINFIEKHIEKIVLAIAVIFFLSALWFFVFNSFSLEIRSSGGQKRVSVMEVETEIRGVAKKLDAALKDSKSPLKQLAIQPYAQQFADRQDRSVIEHKAYSMPLGEGGLRQSDIEIDFGGHRQFLVARPAAPQELKVKYGRAVLLPPDQMLEEIMKRYDDDAHERDDSPRQALAEYAALGTQTSPRDVNYVSVEAEFNMSQWVVQLQSAPRANRVHDGWWRSRQLLTDVVLERQSRDASSGQWADDTVVSPLPDALSFRHMYDQAFDWDRQDISDRLNQIQLAQDQITQPRFAPLTNSLVWFPPGEVRDDLTSTQQRELRAILNEIEFLEKRRSNLKQRLDSRKLKSKTATSDRRYDRDSSRRLKKPALRKQNASGPDAPVSAKGRENIQKLEDQLKAIDFDLEEERAKKDELLGEEVVSLPGQSNSKEGPIRRSGFGENMPWSNPSGGGLVTSGNVKDKAYKIRVWVHDLMVEPGVTYRYRLRVRVMNPLFRQQRLTERQKSENYNRLSLDSHATVWSKPVHIDPRLQFFVVDTDRSMRQATVEVYCMFNGQRQMEVFKVVPGDTIGSTVHWPFNGESRAVDMQIDALVVDVSTSTRLGIMGNNTMLLYYDRLRQQLDQRFVADDLKDPNLIRLQNEVSQARSEEKDQSVHAGSRWRD